MIRRPNPVLWVYYQFGGRLPGRYRDWVRHDATSRTWLVRVLLRVLVQLAPLFAVLLVVLSGLEGSWPIALGATLLGVLVSLRLAVANAQESVDARLAKYGFPQGHATALRRLADAEANADQAARYQDRWRRDDSST
ncbi:hypothetical protein BLA60_06515 [Actinophytocola xinjiangensis]|uniref:DUF5313 family protein n=1 Tax=Actinophytocola xinjiangensis TaxID=485602 RepID=A0A7Z1B109_9PSEU|nr:DUF5313 family protein [Actinophytocola xinjiangensis]OLF12905.1 hypothetical protein BLA60_06515 [Actinophytocola xinjiangensis]